VGVISRINDIEPDAPLSLGQKIWLKETKASAKKGSHKAKSNTHFVEDGDTLAGIARKYSVTIEQLCAWNGLKRTDRLRIGQKIKIVA
jgi:membrane-bound lytic murein transglycosylase D